MNCIIDEGRAHLLIERSRNLYQFERDGYNWASIVIESRFL